MTFPVRLLIKWPLDRWSPVVCSVCHNFLKGRVFHAPIRANFFSKIDQLRFYAIFVHKMDLYEWIYLPVKNLRFQRSLLIILGSSRAVSLSK